MNKPMTQQEKQAAYDAWYIAEVEKGLADVDAGRVLTQVEAEKDMKEFMAALRRKCAKKAA